MTGQFLSNAPVSGFQGTFRVYPLPTNNPELDPPHFLSSFPSPSPKEVVARVYVVLAKDLAPKDTGGSSDPYIIVNLGKQSKSSVKEYKPNTLSPIFGSWVIWFWWSLSERKRSKKVLIFIRLEYILWFFNKVW